MQECRKAKMQAMNSRQGAALPALSALLALNALNYLI
jgi:hypothetical protein